jgi:hypothetical protein
MALTSKSPTKSSVAEKKVKASRKVESKVVPPAQQEEPSPIEEVKEVQELKEEELKEVQELKEEELKEVQELKEEEFKQEVKEEVKEELEALKVANLLCDDEPLCLSKKCVKSKPLVNENGDYLNPLTNRYVKFGSSNFKKLLSAGIIKPVELDGV